MLLIIPLASASISSYIDNVNSNYVVVADDNAPGSDSLAAADIVTGVQRLTSNKVIMKAKLRSENKQLTNLILIGHPCDNKLIPLECEAWSYKDGEAVVMVFGSNLIVSGSTAEDTRRAAKIIANYKDYSELRDVDKIIIKGDSLEIFDIELKEQKHESEMVCGDDVCESGEICAEDCFKTEYKQEEETQEQIDIQEENKEIVAEEKGFFSRILDWIKNILS